MGKKLAPHLFNRWLEYCWHMRVERWDTHYHELPGFVMDAWYRFMQENPDSPAHRDQLQCTLLSPLIQKAGWEKFTASKLMELRLFRPWRPGDEEEE